MHALATTPDGDVTAERSWCEVYLCHLEHFATLAHLLTADANLAEGAVLSSLGALERSRSQPGDARDEFRIAQRSVISVSLELIKTRRRRPRSNILARNNPPLQELPDCMRLAFVLRHLAGCTRSEIGQFLRISDKEVQQALTQAVLRLHPGAFGETVVQMPKPVLANRQRDRYARVRTQV